MYFIYSTDGVLLDVATIDTLETKLAEASKEIKEE